MKYEQSLYKIVEPIRQNTIKRLNKGKKWEYGYNKENDVVVISKTGMIGEIIEIQNRQKTLLDMTGSGDSPDAMDEPPITIKELRNLRTIINTEARKLKKDDDFDGFRRLRYIAESLREDILSLVDDANAAEFRDQLIAANKYSVALNDTFTRSAIGQKVFQTNKDKLEDLVKYYMPSTIFDDSYLMNELIKLDINFTEFIFFHLKIFLIYLLNLILHQVP